MLASVQKSGKAHTDATELRENRLAITQKYGENRLAITEIRKRKMSIKAPCMSTSAWCAKTNYLEAYSEICSAGDVVSSRNSIVIIIRILVPVIQSASKLRSHYATIYEYIRKDGTM